MRQPDSRLLSLPSISISTSREPCLGETPAPARPLACKPASLGKALPALLLSFGLFCLPTAGLAEAAVALHSATAEVTLPLADLVPEGHTVLGVEAPPSFGILTIDSGGYLYQPLPDLETTRGDSFLLRIADATNVETVHRVTLTVPTPQTTELFQDGIDGGIDAWTALEDPDAVLDYAGDRLEVSPATAHSGWLLYETPVPGAQNGGEEGQHVVITSLPDIPPPGHCFDGSFFPCLEEERVSGDALIYTGLSEDEALQLRIWQSVDPGARRIHVWAEAVDASGCSGGCRTPPYEVPEGAAVTMKLTLSPPFAGVAHLLLFEVETDAGDRGQATVTGLGISSGAIRHHRFGLIDNQSANYPYALDDFEVRRLFWREDLIEHHLSDEMEDGWHTAWRLGSAGALDLTPEAALGGDLGLELDVQQLYEAPAGGGILWSPTEVPVTAYSARMDVDVSRLSLPPGSWIRLLGLLADQPAITVDLRPGGGGYQIRLRAVTHGPVVTTPWEDFSKDPHQVAVRYDSEAGFAALWVDGSPIGQLTGLQTAGRVVDKVKIGGFGLVVGGLHQGDLGRISMDGFAGWY